ncbi:MAG: alcohol dehydrogenase catalytic domain-containing protein [Victivallales bacterium]
MEKLGTAAVFKGPNEKFEIRKYPVGKPVPGNVLLKLEYSGICGTDIHICKGNLPMPPKELIIGHEFTGKVESIGNSGAKDALGNPIRTGDTVIACVAIPCEKCFCCGHGELSSCMNFGVTYLKDPEEKPHFHGGFAEYLFSPAKNIVRIPVGVTAKSAAAFPCGGPTVIRACAYAGGLEAGELVVVQGTGALGIFAVALAVSHGCKVVAIGSSSNPERSRIVEKLGAELVLDYRKVSREERLKKIQQLAGKLGRGNGADVVIETSGSPEAFPEGLDLVRTRGRYIVPGQYSSSGGVKINPELITFKAIRITGSGQYCMDDIGAYLEFLKTNPRIAETFSECITHEYKVQDADSAIADVAAGKAIKAVFK